MSMEKRTFTKDEKLDTMLTLPNQFQILSTIRKAGQLSFQIILTTTTLLLSSVKKTANTAYLLLFLTPSTLSYASFNSNQLLIKKNL